MMNSTWNSELKSRLVKEFGEKQGLELLNKYAEAFSTGYREECSYELSIDDIKQIEKLTSTRSIDINFYLEDDKLHLRLFKQGLLIPLSDVLPMLENLDLRVLAERPYKVTLKDKTVWISDFAVVYSRTTSIDFETIEKIFICVKN